MSGSKLRTWGFPTIDTLDEDEDDDDIGEEDLS